jgi:3-phosphoshikimate 1-carboxyvinyltransferase
MSTHQPQPDPLEVEPFTGPVDATVRPPGSKSITNRALVAAALADGRTVLDGALVADDTDAMARCLRVLGVEIGVADDGRRLTVGGVDGRPPVQGALLDARLSGTTSRFVAPVACLADATVVLDGGAPLRRRPMADLLAALEHLGASVEPLGDPGCLPVQLSSRGLSGGTVEVAGDVSSQFLSGLMLSGPCMRKGLTVTLTTTLVSRPYVEMTAAVMRQFGAVVDVGDRAVSVAAGGYRAVEEFTVEPDASAASYWFALAAVTGGRVRVQGLGSGTTQGDLRFVDLLAQMGAAVEVTAGYTEVRGTGTLRGIDVDMADCSDTAQTLAAVAPFADGPTTVRGIGFIRGKETDRVAAVVTELGRLGIAATEDADGFTVQPGRPRGATVRTYDDHRMAMSFAVLAAGADAADPVRIADPGCVAKTYPGFWDDLAAVRSTVVSRDA